MRKRTKLNKTWDYVLPSDDVRNEALWRSSPESMKVYQLFVEEVYSVNYTSPSNNWLKMHGYPMRRRFNTR